VALAADGGSSGHHRGEQGGRVGACNMSANGRARRWLVVHKVDELIDELILISGEYVSDEHIGDNHVRDDHISDTFP
jgi:hypothetical protein